MRIAVLLTLIVVCGISPTLLAQDHNPLAGDPKAIKAGEFEFRINCAFCHGLGARGGGRGPDLTRAQKRHGRDDASMFRNINNGIPGTAMPANGTNGQGVGMTEEEIWQIVAYLRSLEVKVQEKGLGDAKNGKRLFYGDGNCSLCHMVNGNGGRVGPDLTGVGISRTTDSLVESIRNPSQKLAWGLTEPSKEFAQEYETVTVVLPDGKKIQGVTLNEDSFTLQMMDASEKIYLLDKNKLQSVEKSRKSFMPAYNPDTLSDQNVRDIVAYLLSASVK